MSSPSPLLSLRVLALAASAAALCADTKRKMQEAHIDVLASIAERDFAASSSTHPEQLHLSLTGQPGELFVTWVLPDAGARCDDSHATLLASGATFPAAWTTYQAGVAGWAGHIYTAKMTGLAPAGAALSYSVTSCGNTTGPLAFVAPQAPGPTAHSLVAVMADMGTVIPLGFATAAQIEKDHKAEPFDLFQLAGDVAYATTDPPKDELEAVWDAYGRMTEPFMALAPFAPNVGNRACFCAPSCGVCSLSALSRTRTAHVHTTTTPRADEHTPGTLTNASGTYQVDYAAFQARYGAVPPNGNSNLWYSYNHGAMHVTCINSEELQTPGSPQAQWLAADLAAVDRAVTPWLIMMQHRPVYSSTKSEAGDHTPGMGFPAKLEPYIKCVLRARCLAPAPLCARLPPPRAHPPPPHPSPFLQAVRCGPLSHWPCVPGAFALKRCAPRSC